MPGRNQIPSEPFNFSYQGQETMDINGIKLVNFELRNYDPYLGRWMSADPYHQFYSPYLAMFNNPVRFVDPDGGWACSGPDPTVGWSGMDCGCGTNNWETQIAMANAMENPDWDYNALFWGGTDASGNPYNWDEMFFGAFAAFFENHKEEKGGYYYNEKVASVGTGVFDLDADGNMFEVQAYTYQLNYKEYSEGYLFMQNMSSNNVPIGYNKNSKYIYTDEDLRQREILKEAGGPIWRNIQISESRGYARQISYQQSQFSGHHDWQRTEETLNLIFQAEMAIVQLAGGLSALSMLEPVFLVNRAGRAVNSGLKAYGSLTEKFGEGYQSVAVSQGKYLPVQLGQKLNRLSPGTWNKVYEAGLLNGSKVETHYFYNSTTGQYVNPFIKSGEWGRLFREINGF